MGLLRLLRTTAAPPDPAPSPAPAASPDWFPVLAASQLLQSHAAVLSQIRQQVGVPAAHWNALYQPLLERYAAFVQQLPASEAHHHRRLGGLLKHGLQTTFNALAIRRGILLPPGSSAEELSEKQDVWTYAAASAALLHDLGKPVVDQHIALRTADGKLLGRWNPLAGPIVPPAASYAIRYVRGRRYRLHPRLPPMLVQHLVPPVALVWLVQDLDVFEAWLAVISGGDTELAGELGRIVKQADSLSVAADLGGEPGVAAAAGARQPLAERLALGLRKLIDNQSLPLNRPGAAGFVIDDDLWLVSKRALDALRDELSTDTPAGVPSRNERLMDELQQHGILMPYRDRAIWMAMIELGDWRQLLSLLRIPLGRLWTDPASRPPAVPGRIVPETADGPSTEAQLGPPGPPPTAPLIQSQPVDGDALPPLVADASAGPVTDNNARHPGPANRAVSHSIATATGSVAPEPAGPPSILDAGSGEPSPTSLADNDLIQWIVRGLTHGRLKINTVDARLHMTQEGLLLVSPGIFRDFAGMDGWLNAQKRLIKLKAHLRTPDRTNIWTYRVVGERKSTALLKGILIADAAVRLNLHLPEPNTHLALVQPAGSPASAADSTAGPEGT